LYAVQRIEKGINPKIQRTKTASWNVRGAMHSNWHGLGWSFQESGCHKERMLVYAAQRESSG
jgi:hypothetical protein